jgi:hypothetical protein
VTEQFLAFTHQAKHLFGKLENLRNFAGLQEPACLLLIQGFISALTAMISWIMTRKVNASIIIDIEQHIKIFLSAVHYLDQAVNFVDGTIQYSPKKLPFWFA